MFDIAEINKLIHLNFFKISKVKDQEKKDAVTTNYAAFTFVAYALPSLNEPNKFIDQLEKFLGKEFLKSYLKTHNMRGTEATKLSLIEYIDIEHPRLTRTENGQTFVTDIGFWRKHPTLHKRIEDLLYTTQQDKPLLLSDFNTHSVAVHKSADVSHVTAFQLLVNSKDSPLKDVKVEYSEPIKVRERKEFAIFFNEPEAVKKDIEDIEFTLAGIEEENEEIVELKLDEHALKETSPSSAVESNDTWVAHKKLTIAPESETIVDNFTQDQIGKLKAELTAIGEMSNEDLYRRFQTHLLADKEKELKKKDLPKEYKNLSDAQKVIVDKKFAGLKFKTAAALRLADSPHLTYPDKCGLSVIYIIATIYWSSKDVKNFRDGDFTADGNLLLLINQMHDAVRGYDIDDGRDKPEIDEFPPLANPGYDSSRCQGGKVNSLAQALTSSHTAYHISYANKEQLQNKVKLAFRQIVASSEFIEAIKKDKALQAGLGVWLSTGILPNQLLVLVEKQFNKNYRDSIDEAYLGDLTEEDLATAKAMAKQVVMPRELATFAAAEAKYETVADLANAITGATLPLLKLDAEHGYRSTYEVDYATMDKVSQLVFSGTINLVNLHRYTKSWASHTVVAGANNTGYDLTLSDLAKLSVNDYTFYINNKNHIDKFFQTAVSTPELVQILNKVIEQNLPTLFELLLTAKFKNGNYAVVDAYKKALLDNAFPKLVEFVIRKDLDKALTVIVDTFKPTATRHIQVGNNFYTLQQYAESIPAHKCLDVLIEKRLIVLDHIPRYALPVRILTKLLKLVKADSRVMHDAILESQFKRSIQSGKLSLSDANVLIGLAKGTQVSMHNMLAEVCRRDSSTFKDKLRIVEALIENGANVNHKFQFNEALGYNALHVECCSTAEVEVIDALVAKSGDAKAYVNLECGDGRTPLELVAGSKSCSVAAINALIKHGAEVSDKSLMCAVVLLSTIKPDVISLLIEKGANVTESLLDGAARNAYVDSDIFSLLLETAKAKGLKFNLGNVLTAATACGAIDCGVRKTRALLDSQLPKEGDLSEEDSATLSNVLDKLFSSDDAIEREIAILKVLLEYPQIKKLFTAKHLENLLKLSDASVSRVLEVFVDNGVYIDEDTLGRVLEKGVSLDSIALEIVKRLPALNCELFISELLTQKRGNLLAACLALPNFKTAVTASHVLAAITAGNDLVSLTELASHCSAATADEAKAVWDAVCTSTAKDIDLFITDLLTNEVFNKAVTPTHVRNALENGREVETLIGMINCCGDIPVEFAELIIGDACSSKRKDLDTFIQTTLDKKSFKGKVTNHHLVNAFKAGRSLTTLTALLVNVAQDQKFSAADVKFILNAVCTSKTAGMEALLASLLKREEFKAAIKTPGNEIVEKAFYDLHFFSFDVDKAQLKKVIEVLIDNEADLSKTYTWASAGGDHIDRNPLYVLITKKEFALIVKALEKGATFNTNQLNQVADAIPGSKDEWSEHYALFKRLVAQKELFIYEFEPLCRIGRNLLASVFRISFYADIPKIESAILDVLAKRPTPIHSLIHTNIYSTGEKSALIESLVKQRFIVKVNATDTLGRTPLDLALSYKNFDIAKKLVELGASVSFANRYTMFQHNYHNPFTAATSFKTIVGLTGAAFIIGAGLYSSETFQKNCVPVIKPFIEPIANKIMAALLAGATKCKAVFSK